jgi:putative sigma-54 modulation protein
MDVIIQGHNLKVNEPLETFTRKKIDKLPRYLPNIYEIRVDLSNEHTRRGDNFMVAQITIRHERGAILRAEEKVQGDIQAAINLAVDKMYRQIQRFKGKRVRKGRERFTATLEELGAAEPIPDVEEYTEEYTSEVVAANGTGKVAEAPPPQPEIIRRKDVALVAMNEAEAVEQMELLGHNFFVFYNAETGQVNVLYRREAGGYGLLVPHVE